MKIAKGGRLSIAALGMLCMSIGQFHAPAFAATATKKTTTSTGFANSLKISPLRNDLTIPKGQSGTATIYITNLTDSTVQYKPIENDFVAGDEKGTPAIILDPNSYAPSHSLKRFMVPLQVITVGAHQTATVTVTVKVPKTAQAGGYFGALRFAPGGSAANTSVNLNPGAASLMLLTVPGPTVEQLTLTNFDVQQNGGTATNFRTPDDLSLFLRFTNKGNLQEAPYGQIDVQKGRKIVYAHNFNQTKPQNEILPDSSRRWIIPLKGMSKFGKYNIVGTFSYGTKGQSVDITKTIWIIPSGYILAGVIGILVLVALVVGLWVFLRSYKRRILKSSRRRY